MSDIEILRSGELMVSHVSGETDAGIEFVDGYMPGEGANLSVVDSGRIILPNDAIDSLVEACKEQGLTVERREGM